LIPSSAYRIRDRNDLMRRLEAIPGIWPQAKSCEPSSRAAGCRSDLPVNARTMVLLYRSLALDRGLVAAFDDVVSRLRQWFSLHRQRPSCPQAALCLEADSNPHSAYRVQRTNRARLEAKKEAGIRAAKGARRRVRKVATRRKTVKSSSGLHFRTLRILRFGQTERGSISPVAGDTLQNGGTIRSPPDFRTLISAESHITT
jgi:hypothetical protein